MRKAVVGVAAIVCITIVLYFSYDYLYGFLRPQPDFEISADPDSVILESYEESSNFTVVTLKSISGFTEDVSLKLKTSFGIMGDIRFDLSSDEVHLPPDGKADCVLSLFVASFVPSGEYYVDVVATAGQIEHSVRIIIAVSP